MNGSSSKYILQDNTRKYQMIFENAANHSQLVNPFDVSKLQLNQDKQDLTAKQISNQIGGKMQNQKSITKEKIKSPRNISTNMFKVQNDIIPSQEQRRDSCQYDSYKRNVSQIKRSNSRSKSSRVASNTKISQRFNSSKSKDSTKNFHSQLKHEVANKIQELLQDTLDIKDAGELLKRQNEVKSLKDEIKQLLAQLLLNKSQLFGKQDQNSLSTRPSSRSITRNSNISQISSKQNSTQQAEEKTIKFLQGQLEVLEKAFKLESQPTYINTQPSKRLTLLNKISSCDVLSQKNSTCKVNSYKTSTKNQNKKQPLLNVSQTEPDLFSPVNATPLQLNQQKTEQSNDKSQFSTIDSRGVQTTLAKYKSANRLPTGRNSRQQKQMGIEENYSQLIESKYTDSIKDYTQNYDQDLKPSILEKQEQVSNKKDLDKLTQDRKVIKFLQGSKAEMHSLLRRVSSVQSQRSNQNIITNQSVSRRSSNSQLSQIKITKITNQNQRNSSVSTLKPDKSENNLQIRQTKLNKDIEINKKLEQNNQKLDKKLQQLEQKVQRLQEKNKKKTQEAEMTNFLRSKTKEMQVMFKDIQKDSDLHLKGLISEFIGGIDQNQENLQQFQRMISQKYEQMIQIKIENNQQLQMRNQGLTQKHEAIKNMINQLM
ncbi:UNKNOWN [Stylonychia lemnae]|uniref:Uncharacterized protein n=1 Tax=Stylonychia lemnae TaxID=5949 RepID=A0A078BAW6_STYLE|nr:UNKNOWN [Stylonychia lemnae]|eukprot:CDW91710.1 UNKNOWN [Stylonychia lemnae]